MTNAPRSTRTPGTGGSDRQGADTGSFEERLKVRLQQRIDEAERIGQTRSKLLRSVTDKAMRERARVKS